MRDKLQGTAFLLVMLVGCTADSEPFLLWLIFAVILLTAAGVMVYVSNHSGAAAKVHNLPKLRRPHHIPKLSRNVRRYEVSDQTQRGA